MQFLTICITCFGPTAFVGNKTVLLCLEKKIKKHPFLEILYTLANPECTTHRALTMFSPCNQSLSKLAWRLSFIFQQLWKSRSQPWSNSTLSLFEFVFIFSSNKKIIFKNNSNKIKLKTQVENLGFAKNVSQITKKVRKLNLRCN